MSLDFELIIGACDSCGRGESSVFDANITHNLNKMADAAGIYKALWRPEEIGATHARDILPRLREGYERLRNDPERFKTFDAENGWGTYDQFLPWVAKVISACEQWPEAKIEVCR